MAQIVKKDKLYVDNLIRALRKAKFEDLVGEEILALAEAWRWLGQLGLTLDKEEELPAIQVITPLDESAPTFALTEPAPLAKPTHSKRSKEGCPLPAKRSSRR